MMQLNHNPIHTIKLYNKKNDELIELPQKNNVYFIGKSVKLLYPQVIFDVSLKDEDVEVYLSIYELITNKIIINKLKLQSDNTGKIFTPIKPINMQEYNFSEGSIIFNIEILNVEIETTTYINFSL